jgi:hypothetical protein
MSATRHPLLTVPFWRAGETTPIRLTETDISCIAPGAFAETTIRVFVTDRRYIADARQAFEKWQRAVKAGA